MIYEVRHRERLRRCPNASQLIIPTDPVLRREGASRLHRGAPQRPVSVVPAGQHGAIDRVAPRDGHDDHIHAGRPGPLSNALYPRQRPSLAQLVHSEVDQQQVRAGGQHRIQAAWVQTVVDRFGTVGSTNTEVQMRDRRTAQLLKRCDQVPWRTDFHVDLASTVSKIELGQRGHGVRRNIAEVGLRAITTRAVGRVSDVAVLNSRDRIPIRRHGEGLPTRCLTQHATQACTVIRALLGSFPAMLLNAEVAPRSVLTSWISGEALPAGLSLGEECEMKDSAEGVAVVKCQHQELRCDEIDRHLDAGKQVTKLALVLQDNLSFVLADDLAVRKLKFLDGALDQLDHADADGRRAELDARFALQKGELGLLFDALAAAFRVSKVEG